MPLRFTDHRTNQSLEYELRELWRRLDNIGQVVSASAATGPPGPPGATGPPGSAGPGGVIGEFHIPFFALSTEEDVA
jgi:hypothetical protein